MLAKIGAFLFGYEPATFVSHLPVQEAVASLRAVTAKSALHSLTRISAAGTVREDKVSLQKVIPFVGNSFKPYFVGHFEVQNGQTFLLGAFTMHRSVKIFMTFWFGFGVLWTLMALAIAFAGPVETAFFPAVGCAILLAGFALVRLGQWFARNDSKYLTELISNVLDAQERT